MELAILGLPQTGKKTLFQLLTGVAAEKAPTKDGMTRGIAPVRDPRIDKLSAMYNPKRTRYAEFAITLIPDIQPETSRSATWLDAIRNSDALLHVVRAFAADDVFHVVGSVDPQRDIELVNMELLFADLAMVETRLNRLEKDKTRKASDRDKQREKDLLERCRDHLEQEQPLRTMTLSDDELGQLRSLQFLTRKPMVVVINTGEQSAEDSSELQTLVARTEAQVGTVVLLSAAIEAEIAELPDDERLEFMQDLGLSEPAAHRLSRAAYDCLGLISFFTVGPDEVRAWTVRRGAKAPEAASKIHSDLERGFIRAETIACTTLLAAGSEKAAHEAKAFVLNGKEYVVNDGDVINIRFNV